MRRPQFTLRALLVAIVAICVGLGSWRFRGTHRQYVHASPVRVRQHIEVTGQFFHFNGPEIHHFLVLAEAPQKKDGQRHRWGHLGISRRKGAGTYEVQMLLDGAEQPGNHKLMLWQMEPEGPCIMSTLEVRP
ncbi:MAG TPA: hypothetical protein VHC22_17135 [Pirellulales bacterium]|nr:hypothetical protein [Pirellulales bacterium]